MSNTETSIKKTQEDFLDDYYGTSEEISSDEQQDLEDEATDTSEEEEDESEESSNEPSPEQELEGLFSETSQEDEESEDETADADEDSGDDFSLELSEEEFEEVTSSPAAFLAYTNKIKRAAIEEAKALFSEEIVKAKEEILMNIPEVVNKAASRQQDIRNLTTNFYATYPALKEKRAYVRDMVSTVHSQHPEWSAKEVLDEVAKRAQRDLNISAEAEKREKQRKPVFAGTGGRRSPGGITDTRSKQERFLDDTFSKH